MFGMAYKPDMTSPPYRAFNAQPFAKHAGIALKVYFQACGADIIADASLSCAQVLEGVGGVHVRVDVYAGAPHVFWSLFTWTNLAARWKDDARRDVQWLLGSRDENDGIGNL